MLGQRLMELRMQKGCSLSEAAKGIGVSLERLADFEAGRENPSDEELSYLAGYYRVTVEELLSGAGSRTEGKKRLCPYRVKQKNYSGGENIKIFLPCVGKECMAYADGDCQLFRGLQKPAVPA